MPVIPRLRNTSVARRPEQAIASVPAAQGAAVALGTAANVAADVARIAERERDRADEIRVNAAEVEGRAAFDRALLDPKEGILQQRGTRAIEAQDGYEDRVTRSLADIEGSLTSERQRMLFRRQAERLKAEAGARVSAHVGGEMRAVDEESHKALLDAEQNAIARAARTGDAAAVDAAIGRQRDLVVLYGDRNGLAPEAIQQAKVEIVSRGRALQIGSALNGRRVEEARALFAQHGGDLTEADRAKVAGALQEAGEYHDAVREAEGILSKAQSASEANALLGDVPLALRKDVRTLVMAEFDAREKAVKLDAEAAYERGARAIDAAPGALAREVVAPTDWAAMTVEQRNALENRTTAPQNDDRAWHRFRNLSAKDLAELTPAAFQSQYWAKFDASRRTKAESMYDEARKDPAGSGPGWSSVVTDRERIQNALVEFHLVRSAKASDWKDADLRTAADFEQEVDAAVRAWERDNGKKADPEIKQRLIVQRALARTPLVVRGAWWQSNEAAESPADVETDARGRVFVPESKIPGSIRTAIERTVRENGRTVSKRLLEDAMGAYRMNDRLRFEALVGGPMRPLYEARP